MKQSARCLFPAWAIVFLVAGVVLFSSLGLWQLTRAAEKQTLEDQRTSALEAGILPTLAKLVAEPQKYRYWAYQAKGHFLAQPQWLLDNKVRNGRVGAEVLSLFVPDGSSMALLVNRGWFAPDSLQRKKWVPPLLTLQSVELQGRLMVPPDVGIRFEQRNDPGTVLQFVDIDGLSVVAGLQIAPLVLQLGSGSTDDLDRRWPQSDRNGSDKSRAYAAQWFSFAALSVVLFFVLACRRRKAND